MLDLNTMLFTHSDTWKDGMNISVVSWFIILTFTTTSLLSPFTLARWTYREAKYISENACFAWIGVTLEPSTWAIEADPRGLSSNVSNTWPMLWPNSFSRTSRTASNGVAGAWSHKVTSFLTHAAGARSGFPRICAAYWRQWKRNKKSSETLNNLTQLKNKDEQIITNPMWNSDYHRPLTR